MLLGTDAVDRQLQRARRLRRAAQLVVDDAQRPVLEQVDPIGLGANPHRARSVGAPEFELALERMLEQALEHRDFLLDLEVERPLAKARRDGGSEEVGALERAIGFRQTRQRRFGDRLEQLERVVERRRR